MEQEEFRGSGFDVLTNTLEQANLTQPWCFNANTVKKILIDDIFCREYHMLLTGLHRNQFISDAVYDKYKAMHRRRPVFAPKDISKGFVSRERAYQSIAVSIQVEVLDREITKRCDWDPFRGNVLPLAAVSILEAAINHNHPISVISTTPERAAIYAAPFVLEEVLFQLTDHNRWLQYWQEMADAYRAELQAHTPQVLEHIDFRDR